MLRLNDLTIEASEFRLQGLSLCVPGGTYAVLMGATGCGKTTLLETISGLRQARAGRVEISGRDVTHADAAERQVGYVPQDGALFQLMTVRQNLAFPLLVRGCNTRTIDQEIQPLARRLGIHHLLDRRAAGLSGGESQRVALGRALAARPQLLLLDEPLSALDESTRSQMVSLLQSLKTESGLTTLHVTHNRQEAVQLADELFVMENNVIGKCDLSQREMPIGPDAHSVGAAP